MKAKLAAFAVVLIAVTSFFVFGGFGWVTTDGNVERMLTETGVVGPIIFLLVMWATQPLGIPGLAFMIPAGLVWPNPLAIALSWVGNMGASLIAFWFARWFARDWVAGRIPARVRGFDDRLRTGGLWPVVALRLVFGQLPPADWLLGVSKVSTRNFVIGTGIGIIPGIVVIVVAGGSVVDVLRDMPGAVRAILLALLVAGAVARRVWARRRLSIVAPEPAPVGPVSFDTPDLDATA